MCIEDSYISILEQLNDAKSTINSIKDLVMRVISEEEDERDYTTAFDELFGILMTDSSRARNDRCG